MKIAACGLNFADLLMIAGRYQDIPPLPLTMGLEYAGVVDAVGADVQAHQPGDRVAVYAGSGGLADYAVAPADRAVRMPPAMDFATAAAFQIAYGTSHTALDDKARLQPGETLLVLGAAGGVGLTAVEIGARMGARVIAVAQGAEKCAIAAEAGAHLTLDADDDVRARVKAEGGADVVYDPVGGALFDAAFRATNRGGRILVIGFASGDVPPIAANILLVKNISVIGHYWGGYLAYSPTTLTQSLETLFAWYQDGGLRPHISNRVPLEEAATGLDLLKRRAATGKVVVTIDQGLE